MESGIYWVDVPIHQPEMLVLTGSDVHTNGLYGMTRPSVVFVLWRASSGYGDARTEKASGVDQGPIKRPPTQPWRLADVIELAGAVVRQLVVGLVLALAGAAGWALLSAGSFLGRLPLTLVIAAAIMPMFALLSARADMAMHLDRLGQSGQAPGEEDLDGLTPLGTLLFVSLPMGLLATALGL